MKTANIKTLNMVLSNMGDAFVSLDKEWRYTFVNQNALSLMGKGEHELIGKSLWEIFPDILGTEFEIKYRDVLRTGQPVSFEIYYEAYDLWLSVRAIPFEEGLAIFYNNITDNKKSEEHLRKSLKEISDYKYALDESSIVAITDQKGIIKHANSNFCKIAKYTRAELIGKDHRIINSGFHSKDFIRNLWVTIANGKIWRGELKNKASDGTFYWVDTTIVPFLNEEGKPYQYVAIRADITGRKLAEQELMQFNQELEKGVRERTAELDAFTYSISHDLRAPLRAVNSYAKILEEDYFKVFDDEGKRLLGIVQDNARKMGILIDELLAFSRLGGKELQKSYIDMYALTDSILQDLLKAVSKPPNIILGVLHPLMGDKSLISQVIVNLLSNAIKYSSKKDGPEIRISSEAVAGLVVYQFADNGTGFNMAYADKLFGVFQRLHSEEEFEGTGVGLAIVKRIINKHGGEVWADGVENVGATFYFSLPA